MKKLWADVSDKNKNNLYILCKIHNGFINIYKKNEIIVDK